MIPAFVTKMTGKVKSAAIVIAIAVFPAPGKQDKKKLPPVRWTFSTTFF
jgi:hypothetical protein